MTSSGASSVQQRAKSKDAPPGEDAFTPAPSIRGGLVDCSVNLTHPSLSQQPSAVLERAARAGIGALVAVGTSETSSSQSADLAAQLSQASLIRLISTAGVHPHDASDASENFEHNLSRLAASPTVHAIGECGLDFNRDFSPRDIQRDVFQRQLRLAKSLGMPVLVHCRDAHESLVQALRHENLPYEGSRVLVHCFTGTAEEASELVRLGCSIGVTGWLADDREGRAEQVGAAVREVGLERLVIETDSPFLTPRNIKPSKRRPRTNEPSLLPHVVKAAAHALDAPEEDVAECTARNAREFFRMHLNDWG